MATKEEITLKAGELTEKIVEFRTMIHGLSHLPFNPYEAEVVDTLETVIYFLDQELNTL